VAKHWNGIASVDGCVPENNENYDDEFSECSLWEYLTHTGSVNDAACYQCKDANILSLKEVGNSKKYKCIPAKAIN